MTERSSDELDSIAAGCRRLDAGAPPPQVDAAVRAAARTASRRRRVSAWTIPAALAATVLVAFSLVIQVQRDEAVPVTPQAAPAGAPAAAAILQEAAPAPSSGDGPVADRSAEKSALRPAAAAAERRAPQPAAGSADSPQDWLARIEELEAAGRHEEAEAERRRLEAAHPGWLAEHATQRD